VAVAVLTHQQTLVQVVVVLVELPWDGYQLQHQLFVPSVLVEHL
jgi:hypothetical protein